MFRLSVIRVCLLFLCLAPGLSSQGGVLKGTVADEAGNPLPYVSVYIQGTTTGTTTNSGGFYSLNLPAGRCVVLYQFVGFELHREELVMDEKGTLWRNIRLKQVNIQLPETVIEGGGEDPAYAIIRKAIAKRKYYLKQVADYSCLVYIKEVNRIRNAPEKFMGLPIPIPGLDTSRSGIIYLSETVSDFYFSYPDKSHERILSSKVSGNKKGFSWNRASDLSVNFYEGILQFGPLSPRGIISPLAGNAFLYYDYRLEGFFEEAGVRVNKIRLTPRRLHDPVLAAGYLYIQEDSWRIHAVDVLLQKNPQVDYLDSLRIRQGFIAVNDTTWLVLTQEFDYDLKILGFDIDGQAVGFYSRYKLNPDTTARDFRNERVFIEEHANERDTGYWASLRPVPLTSEEKADYRRKDSLEVVRQSQPYLDSLDKVTNKLTFWKAVFWGYQYEQRFRRQSFRVSSLVENIAFNYTEGWNAGIRIAYRKSLEDKRSFRLTQHLHAGFGNKRLAGGVRAGFQLNRKRGLNLTGGVSRDVLPFNNTSAISPFLNSLYCLVNGEDFFRLYGKDHAYLQVRQEVRNGLSLDFRANWARNYALPVMEDGGMEMTDSVPVQMVSHRALILEMECRIRFAQQYETHPDRIVRYRSKFPVVTLRGKKALGIESTYVAYNYAEAEVGDRFRVGMLGAFRYLLRAGSFLRKEQVYYPDFIHFRGNQTHFITATLEGFQLMDYYVYSTADRFALCHLNHHFNGFLVNKIPFLRRSKFQVVAGANGLLAGRDTWYGEVVFGLENILKTGRVYFVRGAETGEKGVSGIRVGLDLLLR